MNTLTEFFMLGLGDAWVAAAFWLNIFGAAFCVIYAVATRRQGLKNTKANNERSVQ